MFLCIVFEFCVILLIFGVLPRFCMLPMLPMFGMFGMLPRGCMFPRFCMLLMLGWQFDCIMPGIPAS